MTSFEDSLTRKSKEIYDLTVQLGCLKEENHQLKKDLDDHTASYEERLSN
jgi:hypothetical protein